MANSPQPSNTDPSNSPTRAAFAEDRSGSPEMVLAEEQIRVGHQIRVSGRAVLRKYIVTETVTQTFQVRHEEVRLEQEPVSADGSTPGPETGRDPFGDGVVVDLLLHREVPRMIFDVVAEERVRLFVDTRTEQVTVSDSVRSEQLAVDSLPTPPT